ncbi:hypothetical protein [Photorhabdus antumapuensis]|uniref:hypothetical protein n=1 Tax=Photorhabdus antumapuensis TaxID=2862867 RepID=UPI001CEC7860|nr:hypothetical protein [Photorhabdus antumapuensis]
MYFLGYHGTNESSARSILTNGVQSKFLPPMGQIGRGFYIAKVNGPLPDWGAGCATGPLSTFQKIVNILTGYNYNPFIGINKRPAILKVYSTKPLIHCKWSVMNPDSIAFIRAMTMSMSMSTGEYILERYKWLQMVIPFEELKYLHVERYDGKNERSKNWYPRESHSLRTDHPYEPRMGSGPFRRHSV